MWPPLPDLPPRPGRSVVAPKVSRAPSTRWTLATLSLCMLLPALATSTANVGLPAMARAFDASFAQVQWIVLAYLVALAAVIVAAGRLGDLLGRRRLLVLGLGLFTGASLLCGVAPGLELLIAARALQGVGGATVMALTMALVGDAPRERTGATMGLVGAASAVGTTVGPAVGGFLIEAFGWPAIFHLNVPLGAAALALVLNAVRVDPPAAATRRAFDIPGTLLLAFTLAAFALAGSLGDRGFTALNAGLLLGAAVGLVAFLVVETRTEEPLVRLSIFRERGLGAGLAASALVATVMMATLVVGPFYLSVALGLDAVATGLAMSAGPLVAALAAAPAGRAADRAGARRMSRVGLVGMTVGLAGLSLTPTGLGVTGYVGPIMIVTAAYALFQAANNTQVMAAAPPEQRGLVGAMLSLSRNLGLVAGASAMGALFAFAAGAADIGRADPAAVAHGMRVAFAVAAGLGLLALLILAGRPAATVTAGPSAATEVEGGPS